MLSGSHGLGCASQSICLVYAGIQVQSPAPVCKTTNHGRGYVSTSIPAHADDVEGLQISAELTVDTAEIAKELEAEAGLECDGRTALSHKALVMSRFLHASKCSGFLRRSLCGAEKGEGLLPW